MRGSSDLDEATGSSLILPEDSPYAPGTVVLNDYLRDEANASFRHDKNGHLVLQPQPSEDPNDPLNWSTYRKVKNYSIISFYALILFAILDIGTVAWQDYNAELGISYSELTNTYAVACAGLSVGCLIFIPFALKYGRRPVYISSSLVVLGMVIWSANLHTYGEMMAIEVISGLAGATSETLVQMTVADMFFVHHRGTMNGIYLVMVSIGSFLAPVAAGYITIAQGWRWIWWWCTIFFGITCLLFILCYEETKFTGQSLVRVQPSTTSQGILTQVIHGGKRDDHQRSGADADAAAPERRPPGINHAIPMKTYRQRMAFTTKSPGNFQTFFRHTYQPFIILGTFPAVAYTAIQYGSILTWFAILATTEAEYFSLPPYNFSPAGIGLLSLPPMIGSLIGSVYGGPVSDWSILWLTRRNNGIYEPEFRLYLIIFPAFVGPAGLWTYGYSVSAGLPWIVPCIGSGLVGFSICANADIALTFLVDSYREILGDALVGVTFVRNMLATIIVFAMSPWIEGMGFHDSFTLMGCLCLVINLLAVPMIIWGKKFRIMCAPRYREMALKQFEARPI